MPYTTIPNNIYFQHDFPMSSFPSPRQVVFIDQSFSISITVSRCVIKINSIVFVSTSDGKRIGQVNCNFKL